jgi:hypothetical protein
MMLMTANVFARGPARTWPSAPARAPRATQTQASAPASCVRLPATVPASATRVRSQTRPQRRVSQNEDLVDEIIIAVMSLAALLYAG